jgi:hypothetical protein
MISAATGHLPVVSFEKMTSLHRTVQYYVSIMVVRMCTVVLSGANIQLLIREAHVAGDRQIAMQR